MPFSHVFDYTQLYNEVMEMTASKTCEDLKNPNIVCCITRSKNQNVVVYEAGYENGKFASKIDDVMKVYWLDIDPEYVKKARAKGVTNDRCDLLFLEKKIAYGIKVKPGDNPDEYKVTFVALPKHQMILKRHPDTGLPRLFGVIDGQPLMMKQLYVHAKESMLGPKVEYVIVMGIDEGGNVVTHKVLP